jgi:hypothetical protein
MQVKIIPCINIGSSGPAEQLTAGQEGPYFLELISNFLEVRGNSGCLF